MKNFLKKNKVKAISHKNKNKKKYNKNKVEIEIKDDVFFVNGKKIGNREKVIDELYGEMDINYIYHFQDIILKKFSSRRLGVI